MKRMMPLVAILCLMLLVGCQNVMVFDILIPAKTATEMAELPAKQEIDPISSLSEEPKLPSPSGAKEPVLPTLPPEIVEHITDKAEEEAPEKPEMPAIPHPMLTLTPAEPEQKEERPAIDPTKPMVAITFDDGPHAKCTDEILDILEEHRVVATFFEVAQNLKNDPDAVRRAVELGCEVGSHSYRHADLSRLSKEAMLSDLAAADAEFEKVLGFVPNLMRPPYGAMNKAVKTESGKSVVTWSIDTEDWLSRDTDKIVASVQNAGDLNGEVILLHSPYETSVEATRILVPWLKEQGYQLVTITELITHHYGDTVDVNRLYGYSYFT